MQQNLTKLHKELLQYTAVVVYIPRGNEIDYNNEEFPLNLPTNIIQIPNNEHINPFEWASKCIETMNEFKVFILVPGVRFDLYGTRHGRGGGWYDKFLSKVPREWLRIGICRKSQISFGTLNREEWDQPMDLIIVKDTNYLWNTYNIKRLSN